MLGALLLAVAPLGLQAESLGEIADRLSAATPYHATARYEVLLPQSEEPVAYDIALNSMTPQQPDTLAPCDYLIDWTLTTPSGRSQGFNAYFAGHHYRFRDKRLQEYHYDDSPAPFSASGRLELGVQQQAQFASLLPAFIAARFREMATDTTYSYTINENPAHGTLCVSGTQTFHGCEGLSFSYTLDLSNGLPLSSEMCYNPGQLSEQTVSVTYGAPDVATMDITPSEPALMALYPEAFGRYRESGYTLANLPGRPLPAISAPKLDGSRYNYSLGATLQLPTIVAILDADVDGCPETVSQLRQAIDSSPAAAALVLAFVGNHAEAIAEAVGAARPDETILTGARGLARDCGATTTPVIIVCDRSGTVQNVHTGRNKDLPQIVMQEITIAK